MTNFLTTLFLKQNKWHNHSVLIHTLKVTYYATITKNFNMIVPALLHDIGKPFVAYQKDEDIINNEYSFTDHEEKSYQLIKDCNFISDRTKIIVRYHYLIRDIKKSQKRDLKRYLEKLEIWDGLDERTRQDLELFLVLDDLGK